jgi:hypothetical protein
LGAAWIHKETLFKKKEKEEEEEKGRKEGGRKEGREKKKHLTKFSIHALKKNKNTLIQPKMEGFFLNLIKSIYKKMYS